MTSSALPTGLLAQVAEQRRIARAAEVQVLVLAVEWAHANPDLDPATGRPVPTARVAEHALAAHFAGLEPEESIDSPSWAGLPRIAWDADAALGVAADMSTTAAHTLLRDALTLGHRLPLTWAAVRAGQVPAWRGRQIAAAVAGAPEDVCAHLDRELADRAGTVGPITLTRIIGEAMIRLYPDEVEAASLERLDRMHVTLDRDHLSHVGLVDLTARGEFGELDDLDHLLTRLAARIHHHDDTIHPDAPLGYRRARALGLLADPDAAARPLTDTDTDTEPEGEHAVRRVNIVVHLTPETLDGRDPAATVTTGASAARALFADAVAAWCGRPGTAIRPTPGRPQPDPRHRRLPPHRRDASPPRPARRDLPIPPLRTTRGQDRQGPRHRPRRGRTHQHRRHGRPLPTPPPPQDPRRLPPPPRRTRHPALANPPRLRVPRHA